MKTPRPSFFSQPAFPYVAPLALFSLFLLGEDLGGKEAIYWLYPAKIVSVSLVLALVWKRLPSLRLTRPGWSLALGFLTFIFWIGGYPFLVLSPQRGGFDPSILLQTQGYSQRVAYALIGIRLLGASLVVPFAEELFWRGFLMRFLINPQADQIPRPKDTHRLLDWIDYDLQRLTTDSFEKNPLGEYRPFSFAATTLVFAAVHGEEWILALGVGALFGWLFVKTKSLGDIIAAHGITNFLLGVYVIATKSWFYW